MKMLCQNPNCDFEHEDQPTSAAMLFCPKCGGGHFANMKPIPEVFRIFPATFLLRQYFWPPPACAGAVNFEWITVKL